MIALFVVAVLAAVDPVVVADPSGGLKDVDDVTLLQKEQAAAAALGTYRVRFKKNERINGTMSGTQTMELLVRQAPTFAVVAEVKAGPNTGRRFLYNAALNKDELYVRESGLLSVVGVWFKIDNAITRIDTNHPVTNLGLAPLLGHIRNDQVRGQQLGGHTRVDEGADKDGNWCMRWTAPKGATGLYAEVSLFCVDPKTYLLKTGVIHDKKGLLEEISFEILERNLTVSDAAFTPEGAGF